MKRCCRKFKLGNLLLKVNVVFIYVYLLRFVTLALNYGEFTTYYRVTLIKLFISIMFEMWLICLKYSK